MKIWQHWYHLLFAIFSIIEAAAVPGHIQCAADLLYVIVLPIAHACILGVQRMAALRSSNIMVAAARRGAAGCGGGDMRWRHRDCLLRTAAPCQGDLIMPPIKHLYMQPRC